jgi:hypothetical protein
LASEQGVGGARGGVWGRVSDVQGRDVVLMADPKSRI